MSGKFSHSVKVLVLNLLLMALVGCIVVMGLMSHLSRYTRHGEAIAIPMCKGMDATDAARLLESKGLVAVVSDSDYVPTAPMGSVLELTPQEGQKVKSGRTIYLTINNRSVPYQDVPDVVDNSSLRQAEARLLASGFRVLEPEMISGEKDWVYGVKYNGRVLGMGERVPAGSSLTLQVGSGDTVESDSLQVDSPSVSDVLETAPKTQTKQKDQPAGESWF